MSNKNKVLKTVTKSIETSVTKTPIMEAHGKEETGQPTMLEQVWGYNELSRYGTTDETVYSQQLKECHRADLEAQARRYGVVIAQDTSRLRDKLLSEFRTYVSLLRKPTATSKKIPNADDKAAALKVLSEGR